MDELLKLIHQSLGKVVYADNIFVALFDQRTKLFSFPYWIDQFDSIPEPVAMRKSLSSYVFRTGKPFLFKPELFESLIEQNEVDRVGSPSPSLVGIPLVLSSGTIGVLVLQHYEKENVYSERDIQFLNSVGSQIAVAVERKQAEVELQNERLLLRTVINNIPDSIYCKDIACRKTLANLTELSYSGATSETEILGMTDFDLYPEELAKGFFADDQLVIQTGQSVINREEFVIDVSGQKYWLLTSKLPIKDEQGKITGLVGIGRDITERRQAEEELRDSEIKLKVILQSTADGILAVDGNGKVIKTNHRFAELWQIPQPLIDSGDDETLISFVLEQLSNPDDFISKVQKLYHSTDEDLDLLHFKNGRIFERFSAPMVMADSSIGRVWSFRDITKHKEAEKDLQESEELYRNLVLKLPDGVYKSTHEGKFVNVNPAMVKILGYQSEEELLAIDIKTQLYFEPTDRESLILLENMEEMGVYRLKRKDGTGIWVEDHGWYNLDENGDILFHEGIMRDVTERKQVEDSLRESEEKYRHMFAENPQPMLIYDLESLAFLEVNQALTDHYGYFREEFLNMTIKDIRPAEDIAAFEKDIEQTRLGENPTGKWRHIKKNGEQIFVEVTAHSVISNGRKARHVLINDITDRIRTEAEIILKNNQLQELNAEKDKFFSIIAHDLRSPFSGFLGLTQVMAEELPNLTMSQVQDIAITMSKSATNLFRLLENLLQWSQMQQGAIPFNPEVIKLNLVLDESIEMIRESAQNKGIVITNNIPDRLEVFADTNLIQTVIRNLLSNAVKFTNKGGIVNLSARLSGEKNIQISIQDTGIGMNQDMIDNLFRIDIKTNRKGTEGEPSSGLGLILCKEFIEKLGGQIGVKSEEGVGSTFSFTIPLNVSKANQAIE